ncbi:MAG: 2Fe-2S iron-sulfur cluster binding domain-containing protein [Acidimicrobiia bacterium]|nr:2Fe-2S iron-sulfur cluster binding domain-containing protein [Acidimicrobiia bacterium]
MSVEFTVNGSSVRVDDVDASLLDTLREQLGMRSVKDGCSPQGQCGCCTVLVDGQPRVACVTPTRRIAGRSVTTLEGLDADAPGCTERWTTAFSDCGASQCGFCTPGIIVRLEGLARRGTAADDLPAVERALAAHLCRCTGWRTIVEAWSRAAGETTPAASAAPAAPAQPAPSRSLEDAARRATLEGGAPQRVGPDVAAGRAGFADDTAPAGALVAIARNDGSGWAVASTRAEARRMAGRIQGRRTTEAAPPPLEVPPGDWVRTLRTTWVEPAYLELDAAWCQPGGEPVGPLANGGAFGAKQSSELADTARRLADEHGLPVRVLWTREDAVRHGPKRPPMAAGLDADGSGILRVARTPGVAEAVASVTADLSVEEVDVPGPPTSVDLRGAGWVEAAVVTASLGDENVISSPDGAEAHAEIDDDGRITVQIRCGAPLDEVVLRSYCIGAAHMALGWVTSESLTVGADGEPLDLTVRSFGIPRASDTPEVTVHIEPDDGPPVNGSDAVFAACALAVWRHQGFPPSWPTGRPLR